MGEALYDLLFVAAGLALLMAGGEALIRGAVGIAERLGISPLVIGLTVVGFGTSVPELVTSLQAASLGSPAIALGNVIGSNIANILLILGIGAMLRPVLVDGDAFRRDGLMVAVATTVCVIVVEWGSLGRIAGLGLVLLLVLYIGYAYRAGRDTGVAKAAEDNAAHAPHGQKLSVAIVLALIGIAVTVLGARLLVEGAIGIAREFGISEAVIGLTVVAVGTSLPELAATVAASLRGHSDVAFGNVVGSNIFNVLGILGITGIVYPLTVPASIAAVDVWVMAGATVLLIVFAVTGFRVTRREGAGLLACYAGYIGWLAVAN